MPILRGRWAKGKACAHPTFNHTYLLGGSYSDEVQVNCPSPLSSRFSLIEVYLMRSGTAITVLSVLNHLGLSDSDLIQDGNSRSWNII